MNDFGDWLAAHAAGRSVLQFGGLGNPGLEHIPAALAAGASRAVHMEPVSRGTAQWAGLRAACAAYPDRFTNMVQDPLDGPAMRRRLPRFDIVLCGQLFHERDPYLLLERLSGHATRHLVVASVRIPVELDGLADGDAVPGYRLGDPRLAIVRRALEARGVRLDQFQRPPDAMLEGGIANWEGMWNWFHTETALRRLIEHFGWRVTHAFPSWGELGITLVGERL
jgi:hypothetical protein